MSYAGHTEFTAPFSNISAQRSLIHAIAGIKAKKYSAKQILHRNSGKEPRVYSLLPNLLCDFRRITNFTMKYPVDSL